MGFFSSGMGSGTKPYKGGYDNTKKYNVGDTVSTLGTIYICLKTSTGNATSNTTYWDVYQAAASGSVTIDDANTNTTSTTLSALAIKNLTDSKINDSNASSTTSSYSASKIETKLTDKSKVVDSSTNGNIILDGSEVVIYDDTTLKNASHTHTNKSTLDKLSDDGTNLLYNGSAITSGSGGSGSAAFVVTALPTPDAAHEGVLATLKGIVGVAEVVSLTLNTTATASSIVTITLNGVATTVVITLNDTAISAATKIRAATFTGWITGGTAGTATVTFTSNTVGTKIDATYSAGTTGATGTMTTTTQGVTATEDTMFVCVKLSDDTYTWIPSRDFSSYLFDILRWGVSNTGTSAVNTSNGINNGLAWAASKGYTEVVMPKGTYLISETIPVNVPSYMTLNLNGSTFQINTNREIGYSIIAFQNNQICSRVTNGILRGDRDTHDYYYWSLDLSTGKAWTLWQPNNVYAIGDKVLPTNVVADSYGYYYKCTTAGTSGATEPNWYPTGTTSDNGTVWTVTSRHTHEGGNGVIVGSFNPPNNTGCNTKFITVDNLEMYNFTGDGLSHQLLYNQIYFSDATLYPSFETGGIYLGETTAMSSPWVFGTHYNQNTVIVSGLNTYTCTLNLAGTVLSTIAPTGTGTTAYGDGYTWQYKGTLGATTTETTRIRSINTVLINNTLVAKWGYFQITGDSYGGFGSAITATLFDIVFYNTDNSFNSFVKNLYFYDDILVPKGASYAKVVLHQGTAPVGNTNNTLHAHVFEFPKHTYTEKCNIHNNRRLGISVTGAKHVYIRDNTIHDIGGTGPAGSIDIEDGYRLNQHIVIERNNMYNTSTGLTVVAARYVTITHNQISDRLTIWNSVDEAVVDNNTFTFGAGANLWGDTTFSSNRMYGSKNDFSNNGSVDRQLRINNCEFHNCAMTMTRATPYFVEINDCRFTLDSEYHDNILFGGYGAIISFPTVPQTISNCTFSGSGTKGSGTLGVLSNASVDPWIMNNNTFLNTKHVDGIASGLPPAVYNSCKFINAGTFGLGVNGTTPVAKYEYNNCSFQWDGYNQFGGVGGSSNFALLKFSGCYFSGGSSTALYLHSFGGKLMLINNVFDYSASASTAAGIINALTTFNPTSVLITGNRFNSNLTMTAIDLTASVFSTFNVVFKDNIVDTVLVKLQNTHKRKNNYINGVLDPYFTVATLPSSDYYQLGQQLLNSNPTSGGYIGWICTIAGTANTNAWTATTAYTVGQTVKANGKVYSCTVAGTSGSTAPSHTTGTATDGTVTWQYVDILAVFNQFGLIQ